jgi:DNA-binding transcriptional ArsR family regulator
MMDSMRRFKAGIFQALAHPTRIAIVEFLQYGELSVGQLCQKVGIEQANASQHLAVLRNKHIVQSRKEGNQIFYSLRDPSLAKVLEAMRDFFLAHVDEALQMLREDRQEAGGAPAERVSHDDTQDGPAPVLKDGRNL